MAGEVCSFAVSVWRTPLGILDKSRFFANAPENQTTGVMTGSFDKFTN